MGQYTRENGSEEWNGAMEKWHIQVEIITKVNGAIIKEMVWASCFGYQAMKNMKVTGRIISRADLELISG